VEKSRKNLIRTIVDGVSNHTRYKPVPVPLSPYDRARIAELRQLVRALQGSTLKIEKRLAAIEIGLSKPKNRIVYDLPKMLPERTSEEYIEGYRHSLQSIIDLLNNVKEI